MSQLEEDTINQIYPSAKTYDELQARRAARDEIRRPKFVAVKVGLQTSLAIAVVAVVYRFITHLVAATAYGDMGSVMVMVCVLILAIGLSIATLRYLYVRTSLLIERVFVNSGLPSFLLLAVIFLIAVLFSIAPRFDYSSWHVLGFLVSLNFVLACCVVVFSPKQ